MIHRTFHASRRSTAAMRRACKIAVLVSFAASLAAAAQDGPPPAPASIDAAMEAYEHCHWDEAFEAVAALADRGDGEAARVALLMLRHGQALYRREFAVTADRRAAWLSALGGTGTRTAARAAP
ncbi:MAG: hypothetical protein HYZ20_04375 [Burkholderiales bacterium]|nr:hypothetical protein [Burkholderiales bacterium]